MSNATFESRIIAEAARALKERVDAMLDSLVRQSPFDEAAFRLDRHNYVPIVKATGKKLPKHSITLVGNLHTATAGHLLPSNVVCDFGLRNISALTTMPRVYTILRDTPGDVGMVMRALVGAVSWEDASPVGRYAILLRRAVESRRGHPLPSWSAEDIARYANDSEDTNRFEVEERFQRQQRAAKFKLRINDPLRLDRSGTP